ncbi:MAG: RNA polymerase sigma-70 factor [Chitinophagaceae bacterium]|nr:MAG: RNA polymerase sigma-70 factor [Chitinophagaceae bacterium]
MPMLPFEVISSEQLKGLQQGNESAFQQIYQFLAPKVYRFAYGYLKDSVQSEEVVQEAFISLWENRQKIDHTRAIEPYIFTISKRLVLDNFRRATSSNALRQQLILKISENHNETEEGIILSDLMNFAERAIGELPKQQQQVFRLSRFEGLSYEEIGERMNLSKNTVKNHLVVAVKTLKVRLGRQEIIYTLLILISCL